MKRRPVLFPFSFIPSVNTFWAPAESQVLNADSDDTPIRHTSAHEKLTVSSEEGRNHSHIANNYIPVWNVPHNSGECPVLWEPRRKRATHEKADQGGDVRAGSSEKKPFKHSNEVLGGNDGGEEGAQKLVCSVSPILPVCPTRNRKSVEVVREWPKDSQCVEGCFPCWDPAVTMATDNKWEGH